MCSESLKILLDAFKNIKDNNDYLKADKRVNLVHKLVTEWNELVGNNLVIGQMLDLQVDVRGLLNVDLSINNDALLIMTYKTSSIFILSFILGAIYSCNKNLDYEEFKNMGLNFGILFQIVNDFCDLEEDRENKNTNFILSNGFVNSLKVYMDKKREMLKLLKNNNLFTREMMQLIKELDEKLILNIKLAFSKPTNLSLNTQPVLNKQYCIKLLKTIVRL